MPNFSCIVASLVLELATIQTLAETVKKCNLNGDCKYEREAYLLKSRRYHTFKKSSFFKEKNIPCKILNI